ncbi:siphovirus Gp157 family protein [Rhizobium sp. CNPSo 3968]|uniref:siphovirus Gp157 family protein n=1 Tax=Rhizobium sp. CNPSo 3968 TaxID=3021408 RepID=UPI00254DE5C3|nr:siphovirus Gp157 family protein [Rhizobium sp. CNPSo 3968]MDK4720092.1 siphovirus Gp157 family protein [Rhizobium sp. CNPSo 3968]
MSHDAEFNVARQAEAAKRLLANLRSQGADDDQELIADSIEGETSLLEAIEAALSEIDECEIQIVGLKAKEAELSERRRRMEERAERIRATIEQAMIATEQESFRMPSATLTLTKRAPGLIVINEADIPTRFWIEQERPAPTLDKKALRAALDEGTVPGATLDNGSRSLSVRRK